MNFDNADAHHDIMTVGFAGLGTMGAPMARNLLAAGFTVSVWNRTASRCDDLVLAGARRAENPRELATGSDVVVTCLTDSPDVEAVLFGENGLAMGLAPGATFVDCSTVSPLKAEEFARRLRDLGVGSVDAPVTGGSEGAIKGTLTILVGGDDVDVARVQPVLRAMGASITHLGPPGAGQWAKAINQVILAGTYLGVAEGVTLALKAGLDASRVLGALAGGAADSWVVRNRVGRMIDNDYPLGFKIALHRKDLGIAQELAKATGADLPVTDLAARFEDQLVAEGRGEDDNSALARIIRRRSGLEG